MKPIFYLLIAFVALCMAISLTLQDAEIVVVGIVIAAVSGVVCGLLKAPEA